MSTLTLEFHEGMPNADGWYLVELEPGTVWDGQPFAVDYCQATSASPSGGREWVNWFPSSVRRWAKLA